MCFYSFEEMSKNEVLSQDCLPNSTAHNFIHLSFFLSFPNVILLFFFIKIMSQILPPDPSSSPSRHSDDMIRIPDRQPSLLQSLPRRFPSSTDSAFSEEDPSYINTRSLSQLSTNPLQNLQTTSPTYTSASIPPIPPSPNRSISSSHQTNRRRNSPPNTTVLATKRARELSRALSDSIILTSNTQSSQATGEIASSAVRALGEFAFASTDAVTLLERQEALIDADAFRRLVEVQSTHLAHQEVQLMSHTIWGALRLSDSICAIKLPKADTIETVVASLRIHTNHSAIVCEGLRALCSLSRLEQIRSVFIAKFDTINVVVDIMITHDTDEEIQVMASRFLAQASFQSEGNKTEIAMHGALQRMLMAARRFGNNRDLHTHACKTLRNLTVSRDDIVVQMTRLNGPWTCIDALVTHKLSFAVTLHALAALYHMTYVSNAATQAVLRHPGYGDAILGAAMQHEDRANIQTLALAVAAKAVKEGGALAARRLVKAGGVRMTLNTMHRFVNVRAVLCYGATLVRLMLNEVENAMEEVYAWGNVDGLVELLYCSVVAPVSGTDEAIGGYAEIV